ncbi:MAG: LacI family DNA-binding transcriptional regulator [Acidimicrobiia bacterium]|nr:LacI family DNA-binding transcriptional regulator [Acidimicrobiia bacterium]
MSFTIRDSPKLRDVAAGAGVSTTTASLVLNGKTDGFPASTVEKVRDSATQLNYRPNAVARSLRRQRTHTVGVISDAIATTPFAGASIRGAQEVAWAAGHVLLLIDTDGDATFERIAVGALLERQVEGLICARMKHEVVDVPAELSEVPTVLLNARGRTQEYSSVAPDEVGGASTAVSRLIAAGHKRIGFIQSSYSIPAAEERLIGYRRALDQGGVEFDPTLVVPDPSEGASPDAVIHLLERSAPPTALFCFNDMTAVGAYNAASRLGLSIPEELSIIGFDNQEALARRLDPALTTIQLPHYEMGRWAMEHLERLIQGDHADPIQHRMDCPLVERDSVALRGRSQ